MGKFIAYLTLAVVVSFAYVILRPKIKGFLGEKSVSTILSLLPKEDYRVLNDCLLPTESGTTQIDHIVLSRFGIFVIETKNYSGKLYGKEFSEHWTQINGKSKVSIYNPLRQNYHHTKVLEGLLELPSSCFIPVVVFSVESTVKVESSKPLVYTVNLNRLIRSYEQEVIDPSLLNGLAKTILLANITDPEARKMHVQSVQKKKEDREEKIKANICPHCGSALVRRTGKYGAFWGCSNYPACKFTKPIK